MPSLARLALALCLLCGWASAAEVLPSAGEAVGCVVSETPGKWVIFSADFLPVQPRIFEGGKVCVFQGPAGRYAVLRIPPGNEQPEVSIVVLGGAPAPVPPQPIPPVPPEPKPPEPTPPPNPPIAGPRQVLILRESADDSPALSRLIVSLQGGKGRDYLKSKGHACFVLDVDDAQGAKWKETLNLAVPAVGIIDSKGNVLAKQNLSSGDTADTVLALLKKWEAQ